MRAAFTAIAVLIAVAAALPGLSSGQGAELPSWVSDLKREAAQALQVEMSVTRATGQDCLDGKEYAVIRLEGEGSLKGTVDPFETMEKLFSSGGWKQVPEYSADSHGSSSSGYQKEGHFCLVSMQIDSCCDDEETGYIPSKFWFSIDCRESGNSKLK
jgi:hypothetical protein